RERRRGVLGRERSRRHHRGLRRHRPRLVHACAASPRGEPHRPRAVPRRRDRRLRRALMTRPFLAASLAAALLVLVRSAPHVLFEGSHFDSDMAIFGIMGLDLARGEPLPFYAYGQQYLLAIEAYL